MFEKLKGGRTTMRWTYSEVGQIFDGKCPVCGSDKIDYDGMDELIPLSTISLCGKCMVCKSIFETVSNVEFMIMKIIDNDYKDP